jgi:hypothetical protein
LSKMAVDRSLASNLSDARDAFINATVDVLSAYKLAMNLPSGTNSLVTPQNLTLFPLYILALLKQVRMKIRKLNFTFLQMFFICFRRHLELELVHVLMIEYFQCVR